MRKIDPEVAAEAVRLRVSQRLSLREIALIVGATPTTICRVLKLYPLTEEEKKSNWRAKVKGQRRVASGRLASGPDLSGHQFGRLIASHRVPTSGSEATWSCRCNCGKEHKVRSSALVKGSVRSCGCLARDLARERQQKDPMVVNENSLFLSYQRSAKDRRVAFNLSKEQFLRIVSEPCTYCGLPPSASRRVHKNQSAPNRDVTFKHSGIDRVDSRGPYKVENCVSCCKQCNYAKRAQSRDDFIAWVDRITAFRSNLPRGLGRTRREEHDDA